MLFLGTRFLQVNGIILICSCDWYSKKILKWSYWFVGIGSTIFFLQVDCKLFCTIQEYIPSCTVIRSDILKIKSSMTTHHVIQRIYSFLFEVYRIFFTCKSIIFSSLFILHTDEL